jgi:hypothetical protein
MHLVADHDNKQKPAVFTPFSLVHALSGVVYALIVYGVFRVSWNTAFWSFFVLHGLYELKDYHWSYNLNLNSYMYNNSLENSIGDQVMSMIGFVLAARAWDTYNLDSVHATLVTSIYFLVTNVGHNRKYG